MTRNGNQRQRSAEPAKPTLTAEYRLRAKDGSYRWILARGQALWDEAGRPARLVGSHKDVTERRMEEDLEAARELKKRMPQVPLILFTMHAGVMNQDEAEKAGFDAIISKTEGLQSLIDKVQALLEPV